MTPPLERRGYASGWTQEDPVKQEERETGLRLKQVERFEDTVDLLRAFLKKTPIRTKPVLEPSMPKRIGWDQIERQSFFMNIWDMEPLLIDALELAHEEHRENQITLVRTLIRSKSWYTHKPSNNEVAKENAKAFLREALARAERGRASPYDKQAGFGFDEEAEAEGWKKVALEVGTGDCKQDRVETSTRFVEKMLIKEWKGFLSLFKDKGKKRQWPVPGTDVVLDPEVQKATERIVRLREIRDQLYYQRLNPNLCAFARLGLKK